MKYFKPLIIAVTSTFLNSRSALSEEPAVLDLPFLINASECAKMPSDELTVSCIPDLESFIKKFDGNTSDYYKDKKVDAWEMLKYFLDTNPSGKVSEETRREIFLEKVNYEFLIPYDINRNDIIGQEDDLNHDNRITIEDWKIYQSLHPPGRYRHLKRRFQKYFILTSPIVAVR